MEAHIEHGNPMVWRPDSLRPVLPSKTKRLKIELTCFLAPCFFQLVELTDIRLHVLIQCSDQASRILLFNGRRFWSKRYP